MARGGDQRAWDELSRSISRLLLQEPFLGHLLAAIPRRIDGTVATAAVARDARGVTLLVNPDFFLQRVTRGPERIGVVKHEVLHILLRHLWRRGDRLPRTWNLACDVVVNRLVGPWPLVEGAVTAATFPGVDLTGDLAAEEVYRRIQAVADTFEPEERGIGDHGPWGTPTEAEAEVADASLERLVRLARVRAKGWGNLPASLVTGLSGWLEEREPRLDWRTILRGFAASSRRTRVRSTLRRPSRRFGTLPGTRIVRSSHLLVAVDTSGSVSDELLAAFFAEIHAVWRAGAEITVVECDAAIHREWTYEGVAPIEVRGRGGTAFEPVFALAAERWPRFDGLVYLTDGEGPTPETAANCPVLWVIHGPAAAPGPGRAVRLV